MNHKTKLTIACTGAISSVFGAAAGVMYYLAYTRCYDKTIHHFNTGEPFPALIGAFILVAVISAIAGAALMPKKHLVKQSAPSSAMSFALWLTAFIMLGFGFLAIAYNQAGHSDTLFGEYCAKAAPVLSMLCAVPPALWVSSTFRGTSLHAISTFIPLLWCIAILFKYYFDISEIPLNDPELTLTVVTLAALGMFWLSECRLALGILSPAFAIFSALPAIAAGGLSAVRIILYATERYSTPTIYENVVFLAISLFALARLINLCKHGELTIVETESSK